jgi:CelD/BcsL family acetyltransferase involved in cellulose biosynthesis
MSISVKKGKNCPVLTLPDNWDEYLGSLDGKSRHELRRKIRKAEKELRDIRYSSTDTSRDFNKDIEDFLLLHRKTSEEKALFMSEKMKKFFELISRVFYKMGWLRIFFLSSGNIRISTMMCFDYQDKIYLYNSGYDPKYSSVSPGMVLLSYCIKDSILRKRRIFDFMRGNERYKYELGALDTVLHNILIFT